MWQGPKTLIVEAPNATAANARAEQAGAYFEGVDKGIDCECCGDRWHCFWGDEKGTDNPESYGSPVVSGPNCVIFYASEE